MALGTWTTGFASGANVTVPSGSGRVAVVFFSFTCTTAPTDVTCTLGGVSMTALTRVVSTNVSGSLAVLCTFYLLDASLPAAGSRAVSTTITGGSGVANGYRAFNCSDDRAQNALSLVSASTSSAGTTVAPGPMSFASDDYGFSAAVGASTTSWTQSASAGGAWTERWDSSVHGGADIVFSTTDAVTLTWTSVTSTNLAAGLLLVPAVAVAPTITSQPTAVTSVLAGPVSNNPATFSVSATTSGGSLTYDWELETSVGGGVYANLADGNGATWTGQTASSCSATLTATTLSGRRVRCNVTDDNGTTTTDAVALTIYAGTTIATPAATDVNGQATAVLTTDVVDSANGQLKLVTFTSGSTVIRTTARKTA